LGLIKPIIGTEPVSIRQVNLAFKFRVLLSKHEGFFPFMEFYMKRHQSFDISQPQVGLLGKGMVASLPEVLGT